MSYSDPYSASGLPVAIRVDTKLPGSRQAEGRLALHDNNSLESCLALFTGILPVNHGPRIPSCRPRCADLQTDYLLR